LNPLDALLSALAGVPRLPGALCAGEPDIWDPSTPDDDDIDTAQRVAFAAKLCRRCPELTPCRSWLSSLRPHQRPGGVVAGLIEGKEPEMPDEPTDYPPDWGDTPPPDPADPVSGTDLDAWRPSYRDIADAADLAVTYAAREHEFLSDFVERYGQWHRETRLPQIILALVQLLYEQGVGSQGERLTIERLISDRDLARERHHQDWVNRND
jgi:WhiB family transcriptional regulator, redox-sensing transcriptional regulator